MQTNHSPKFVVSSQLKQFIKILLLFPVKMNGLLKMLGEKHGIPGLGISREEFIQIHRAFGGNIGQWYKCSKGKRLFSILIILFFDI